MALKMEERGLGFHYVYIPKAASFAMRDHITTDDIKFAAQVAEIEYERGPILDQGREGACVAFGHGAVINAGPVKPAKMLGDSDCQRFYKRAQQLDSWEGEDYDGTSNDAGAKAYREAGYYTEYLWGANPEEMKVWLLSGKGPVAWTTLWKDGMYRTDEKGNLLFVGKTVGGHLMAAIGYRPGRGFIVQNSWGEDFGIGGICYVSDEEMVKMYRSGQWTCCTPVEKVVEPPKPNPAYKPNVARIGLNTFNRVRGDHLNQEKVLYTGDTKNPTEIGRYIPKRLDV